MVWPHMTTIDQRKELRDTACEETTKKTLVHDVGNWGSFFLMYPLIGPTDISALIHQAFQMEGNSNLWINWKVEGNSNFKITPYFLRNLKMEGNSNF